MKLVVLIRGSSVKTAINPSVLACRAAMSTKKQLQSVGAGVSDKPNVRWTSSGDVTLRRTWKGSQLSALEDVSREQLSLSST